MPGVLTHKAIMLLARERIRMLRDLLSSRTTGGGRVTDLERRMLYLATQAHEMMSTSPPPSLDIPSFPQHPFSGVSKFAVMGSMGPDFTAFSAILAPGQGWAFDTVHKGSPDENRELVVARTTDFVFAFYSRALEALTTAHGAGSLSDADFTKGKSAMRSYALGHLCHIAGDSIAHPYINDVEWHEGTKLHEKFSHAGGEGSIEAEVARQVLLRRSTREGQTWAAWWPTVDEVPEAFYTAYAGALEFAYKAASRPPGAPALQPTDLPGAADLVFGDFRQRLLDLGPPAVDAAFVRDGYQLYRNGVISYAYGLGAWGWTGVLVWLTLPMMALLPVAYALPRAGALFRPGSISSDAWAEFFGLALGLASPFFLGYSAWVVSLTAFGAEGRMVLGALSAGMNLVFGVLTFVDLGVRFLAPWTRWLFIILALAVGLTFGIVGTVDLHRRGHGPRGGAALVFALPLAYLVFALVLFAAFFSFERDHLGDDTERGVYVVIVSAVVAIALFVFVAAWLAPFVRDRRIPEKPQGFPAEQRHFVRLFDDASLFKDADGGLYFPAADRPLLKLWWEGTGDLFLRSSRIQLEFSVDGTAVSQTVAAPIAPTTAAQVGQLLAATVAGLRTALPFPDDLDVELPPGAVFADHADDLETANEEDRAIAAVQFVKLGKTEADAFVLHHAPKAAQAIRFGPEGPAVIPRVGEEPVRGSGTVTSQGTAVTGSGTHFTALFQPDDFIQALTGEKDPRAARVRSVASDTELTLDAAFSPDVTSGTPFQRWGSNREGKDGYRFIAEPNDAEPSDAVMDYAADFAALLCLGAVPTLVESPVVPGIPGLMGAVGQVFRNWSLDRRRVNEWRMVVAGGAVSEKAGHPAQSDRAMSRPTDPRWQPDATIAADGERVSNALGWVPLLRQWIDLLRDLSADPATAGGDALNAAARRPDVPPNLDLSRAMAFLFDLPSPTVVP